MTSSGNASAKAVHNRKATLYQRKGRVFVERVDTTVDGIPYGTDEIHVFETPCDEAELGRALRSVITKARSDRPALQQEDWQLALRPLLDAAGVSSWRTFVRGCREVAVFESDGVVRLLPSVNLGAAEGFEGLVDREIVAGMPDARMLGHLTIQSLERAIP